MIEELVADYIDAKDAEEIAKEERRRLGDLIAAELDSPDEGSKTHDVAGYRVTVKRTINRRVDWELFDAVKCEHPPVVTKRSIDAPGLRWLEENDKKTYDIYCRAVTAKPGAVGITIKEAK